MVILLLMMAMNANAEESKENKVVLDDLDMP